MIKKISHITFALLILVTTMGMTVTKHYCGSSLKSTSVLSEPDSCCEIPSGCCHNETITIKIEDDFSVITTEIDFTLLAITLPQIVIPNNIETIVNNSLLKSTWIPPPKIQEASSFLQSFLL